MTHEKLKRVIYDVNKLKQWHDQCNVTANHLLPIDGWNWAMEKIQIHPLIKSHIIGQ